MKLNQNDEHLIKNIKAASSRIILIYLLLGILGLLISLLFGSTGILSSSILYLSGLITGIAVEKYYSRHIVKLCLKLYNAVKN